MNSSRPGWASMQFNTSITSSERSGSTGSPVLENCEAMKLHEVETIEILQVEEIEIVSAQVEDMKYLHRPKTEVLDVVALETKSY